MALYDPEDGYYMSEGIRIGREGDFYTSSHLHPAFGAMVGRQIQEMWEIMGNPEKFTVIEMGAGEGYVCSDMLASLKGTEFLSSLNYIIVEMSPVLAVHQKARLREFNNTVKWMGSLDEIPPILGCIFSNELLDAFPVHLIRMEEDIREIYIGLEKDRLVQKPGPPSINGIT